MTKPITAVAVVKQIERGLVSLDDTLDKYIPEYAEMEIARVRDGELEILGKAQNKIKILHLLTHSGGVACGEVGARLEKRFGEGREYDLESVAREYSAYPISFEPYTAQLYSGRVGFDLLARVVELTSGMSYDEFLKKELFEPLGMTDTTFDPTNEQWDRAVAIHNFTDGRSEFAPIDRKHIFESLPIGYFCGGAGLVSTVSDYEKFADMLLSNGKNADGKQIVGEEYARLLRTVAVPADVMPGNQKWALGMRVITDPSYISLPLNSYGWSGAYGTHFWVDPDNGIVGIYMKNSRYDGGSGAKTASNFEKDVYL